MSEEEKIDLHSLEVKMMAGFSDVKVGIAKLDEQCKSLDKRVGWLFTLSAILLVYLVGGGIFAILNRCVCEQ